MVKLVKETQENKKTKEVKKKPPKEKVQKEKVQKNKIQIVGVPTNKKDKLHDLGVMRSHNFLSSTEYATTKIHALTHKEGNRYEVAETPHSVSTVLKLVSKVTRTNEMPNDWSIILWNISQSDIELPEGVTITFNRIFERKDDEAVKKGVKNRKNLALISSSAEENVDVQKAAVNHDRVLVHAINTGDSVISFGAEAIVTAPDDLKLEQGVEALMNYLASNDVTRGLVYAIDINKQLRPFINYGPNDTAGNKDLYFNLPSYDAATAALFVDSGGERVLGSEYVGVSVGKMIQSHAAYKFIHTRSLYVGNDTENVTRTLGGDVDTPSQIYLSKVASRAYLLKGQNVVHIVADDHKSIKGLMDFDLDKSDMSLVDASKGVLNILEPVVRSDFKKNMNKHRVTTRFAVHLDSIIALLNQFRDVDKISTTDSFAGITRDILVDFFVDKKYWRYDATENMSDIRLFGTRHDTFRKLNSLGMYISERKKSNTDNTVTDALRELDRIVNGTILPTIPALNSTTSPEIDRFMDCIYKVVDLTGMSEGATSGVNNASLNTMMLAYLNVIIPSLKNGDAIFIHGLSRTPKIAKLIMDTIADNGLNLDVIFTEKNQTATTKLLELNDSKLDFVVVDLYNNRVDKLMDVFNMDHSYVDQLKDLPRTFFIKTNRAVDYIYLDNIL